MAVAEKTANLFTEYPANADKFFLTKNIIIPGLPASIRKDIETKKVETKITSAKQYHEYLEKELAFWNANDPKNALNEFSQYNRLKQALTDFTQAISYYNNSPAYPSNGDSRMTQSFNQISNGHLNSKTKLAKFLIAHIGRGSNYISGFMASLSINRNNGMSNSIDAMEGFITGLEYAKVIKQMVGPSVEDLKEFSENYQTATDNYAELNAQYTSSFHAQEERIESFNKEINDKIEKMNANAKDYFAEKEKRCQELENLYEEKLKLQAPAEYWKELDEQYNKAGKRWFAVSVLFTGAIIAVLILTLKYLPNLFSEDSHWIDIFKNSAIITVITSIAVYILRLFVKMTVSSFHLSRDAKERNKLTYFYLSLIEKKAVTEKERAIILNSLFSRADTGLLKGDSAPTMSGNVTDLAKSLSEK